MAAQTTWAPVGPSRYQLNPTGPAATGHTELTAVPTPGEGANAVGQPWNPENPLFWFGAIALATFGLMAASTTVRVGKATASVSVGKAS